MEENWRVIPSYSKYMASDLGRIKTFNWKNKGIERVMKPALDSCGYLRTMLLNDEGKYDTIKVHRIIAKTFIPNPENKETVNHKNSIKSDNRVHNLEWATRSENIKHAYKNDRMSNKGEMNPVATLTDEQVIEIRKNYVYGRKCRRKGEETKKDIAARYGVGVHVIKQVVLGETWKHLL